MTEGRPYCIGIAGPSCSGKTSVARELAGMLPGEVTLFGLDSYYRDLSCLSLKQREQFNFDHPDALENDLLGQHLSELSKGRTIERPVYDFATHSRVANQTDSVTAGDFLIVEGLFTFHWPEIRELFHLKAFVDAPDPVCLERRKHRDIRERGRSMEFVLAQYAATVRPGNEEFVLPTRQYADVVVGGEHPIAASVQKLNAAIRTHGVLAGS